MRERQTKGFNQVKSRSESVSGGEENQRAAGEQDDGALPGEGGEEGQAGELSGGGVEAGAAAGEILRAARREKGLTLDALAERVGCAKSYLSLIENGKRVGGTSVELLSKLEAALGLARGRLVSAAQWSSAPAPVKREIAELRERRQRARRAVKQLEAMLGSAAGADLDGLHKSGALRRLIDQIDPDGARGEAVVESGGMLQQGGAEMVPVALSVAVPLINSVAAGYPTEFTDLGYPARVADDYVRCPNVHDVDAFAARVVGDSMEPLYREGDVVVFSPARPCKDGADCFVRLEPDHETTFKRVFFEAPGPDGRVEHLRLQPLNPKYEARRVHREHVAGLYPAVNLIRSI